MQSSCGMAGTTIQAQKNSLLYQIQLYANLLGGNVFPSSASNDTDTATEGTQNKKRKRAGGKKTGRKSNEEKDAHDYMVKFVTLDLFMDQECRSIYKFCTDTEMEFLRHSVSRLINSDKRLKYIMVGERRRNTELLAEAVGIIERCYPSKEGENMSDLPQQVIKTRLQTLTIFNYYHLKETVGDLDFDTPDRMSRDGTKEIPIHNRKDPSETVKFLIFDLAQRVMAYSNLNSKMRKDVLKLSAKLIMYDHGYKKVSGISNLDKTWGKRLEEAYLNGNNTQPLQSRHKGSTSYTDRLENAHPGYTRELYRYAEKTIGNQASYEQLARVMNEKSKQCPSKPLTRFNATNLYRWFKTQGGKERSPKEKPYLTEDQKSERKKWCQEQKKLMQEKGKRFYACFLDEKWFYITSRRRRIKVLPPGPGEDPAEVAPHIPTAISRRHALKV